MLTYSLEKATQEQSTFISIALLLSPERENCPPTVRRHANRAQKGKGDRYGNVSS